MVAVMCVIGLNEKKLLSYAEAENVAQWMCDKLNKAYRGKRFYYVSKSDGICKPQKRISKGIAKATQ